MKKTTTTTTMNNTNTNHTNMNIKNNNSNNHTMINNNKNQQHTMNQTAIINSDNNTSKVISSHYSNDTMATSHEMVVDEYKSPIGCSTESGMMMNDNDSMNIINNTSAPSLNCTFDDGVDIDLQGIPKYILDLQQDQPTLNIMTCGDVSHGKSTLLAALSGERTGKHSAEKKGNMTIRLGYTSCKIWKCLSCPRPQCYFATHSDTSLKKVCCPQCGNKPNKSHKLYAKGSSKVILIRHLSFVDVPGHAQLMQTMVSATSVADGAILVIDASKPCPGKQTAQHLDAINLLGLMKEGQMIIAQNKIDLIDRAKACLSYEEIRRYLKTFGNDKLAFGAPIIPISAQSKLNIDALCNCIIHKLPKFSQKLLNDTDPDDLRMNIIRSFDVNKAKDLQSMQDIDKIAGGVIGGAVLNGHIRIGQQIEIRPGYIIKKEIKDYGSESKNKCQPMWGAQPIKTTVKSLQYGKNKAMVGFPGGNVGIQTNVDPSLTKGDGMCGHVVIDGNNSNPPPIFNQFVMSYTFLSDAVGGRSTFKQFEQIRVNIGSFKMKAEVIPRHNVKGTDEYHGVLVILEAPVCARVGDTVGIVRQNKQKEWHFVGGGIIRKTKNIFIESDQEKLRQLASRKYSATKPVVNGEEEKLEINSAGFRDGDFISHAPALHENQAGHVMNEREVAAVNDKVDKPVVNGEETTQTKNSVDTVRDILLSFNKNPVFKDKTIKPWRRNIFDYLKQNKINGQKLLTIGRKQFGQELVDYVRDRKVRGAAIKTFDQFVKLESDTNTEGQEIEAKNTTKPQNKEQRSDQNVDTKHQQNIGQKTVGIGTNSFEGIDVTKEAVHIAYQQRNGRKGVTTIVGLPIEVNFKKLAKKMKKQWSTGATLVNGGEKGTVIQIQGDVRQDVPAYIVGLNIVERSQITVHGY